MAASTNLYSLYRTAQGRFVLLRTTRRGYSNVSVSDEDAAVADEQNRRNQLLAGITGNAILVGECHALPVGDELYAQSHYGTIPVFYQQTDYGYPWILIGCAASETAFRKAVTNDEDLMALKPTGAIIRVSALFITELT